MECTTPVSGDLSSLEAFSGEFECEGEDNSSATAVSVGIEGSLAILEEESLAESTTNAALAITPGIVIHDPRMSILANLTQFLLNRHDC